MERIQFIEEPNLNGIRIQPRTFKQFIQSLKVFKLFEGEEWGRNKLEIKHRYVRNIISSMLITRRSRGKDFESIARNHKSSLEKFGLLFINNNNFISITQAGNKVLTSNDLLRKTILLEQIIKFRVLQISKKTIKYSSYNPFIQAFEYMLSYIEKSKTKRIRIPIAIFQNEIFSNYVRINTRKDYANSLLVKLRYLGLLTIHKDYIIINMKFEQLKSFVNLAKKLFHEFWDTVLNKEITYNEFFDMYYGALLYYDYLIKVIKDIEKEKPKLVTLRKFIEFKTEKNLGEQELNELVKDQDFDENIVFDILKETGIQIISFQALVASIGIDKYGLKVSQDQVITTQGIAENFTVASLNQIELDKITMILDSFVDQFPEILQKKPLVIFANDFSESFLWQIWHINRKSWIGVPLPIIPIKIKDILIFRQNLLKGEKYLTKKILYMNELAKQVEDYREWIQNITKVLYDTNEQDTHKIQIIPKDNLTRMMSLANEEFNKLKNKIHQYVVEHPKVWTSEILEVFNEYEAYDVLKALEELELEGRIK